MEHQVVHEHLALEHQTLGYVTAALRSTLDWKSPGADLGRKLSSLRFVAQSFRRHLRRLLALEEKDGYMDVVLSERPEMTEEVGTLRREHEEFRETTDGLVSCLRSMSPKDRSGLERVSRDFADLLDRLDAHRQKETDLVQEALLQDEGAGD